MMLGTPIFTRAGDDFLVAYPALELKVELQGLYEDKTGHHGLMVVESTNAAMPGQLLWERVNLDDGRARKGIATRLEDHWSGGPNWEAFLHQLSEGIVRRFREGEPFLELTGLKRTSERYRMTPLLPDGEITLLFGDGGVGKGFFAMEAAIGLMVANVSPLGMACLPGPVLYLDWETDEVEINDRLARLADGLMVSPPVLLYRRCFLPIAEDIGAILRFTRDRNLGLVIIDSMGLAVGGDPNASSDTIRAMRCLRQLRSTVLCLDHVGKESGTSGKSMGNSYKFHHSRSVWELKRGEGNRDGVIELGLFHHKANNGQRWSPLGFKFTFDGDAGPVEVEHNIPVSSIEGVKTALSVGRRILDAIGDMEVADDELASDLDDLKPDTIERTVRRMLKASLLRRTEEGRLTADKNRKIGTRTVRGHP